MGTEERLDINAARGKLLDWLLHPERDRIKRPLAPTSIPAIRAVCNLLDDFYDKDAMPTEMAMDCDAGIVLQWNVHNRLFTLVVAADGKDCHSTYHEGSELRWKQSGTPLRLAALGIIGSVKRSREAHN